MRTITICFLAIICCTGCKKQSATRETISLNGTWQIADGTKDKIPVKFDRTIRVPGLITSARPEFVDPAPRLTDRNAINTDTLLFYHQQDPLREAYWYRRTFTVKKRIPEVALLKVAKAMFGTRVYLNGKYIGEHLPCFTPGYFDLKPFIKKGKNELVISVGSCRNSLPQDVPDGFDYEKERYISGIYDNVDLILTGDPFIRNVQVAPDIEHNQARIKVSLHQADSTADSGITLVIKEVETGTIAARKTIDHLPRHSKADQVVNIEMPVVNCRLWSPEDPFLYEMEVTTRADHYTTRFGMREFRFDPVTHVPLLNGKPYYLRGSNISMYRFFEDPQCGNLPWDSVWVRKMTRKFKTDMHWNSLRYCIGFPPEEWYNIADEEGILIQDEFPIWYGAVDWNKWTKKLNSAKLTAEFTEWMEERWNHPGVVIWDASNETRLREPDIDSAVAQVRGLDLSRRIWDNSYASYRPENDIFESHPYHFQNSRFRLKDLAKAEIVPGGSMDINQGKNPVIINEYGWLWLNRDGSPTTLTKTLYENLLGKNATAADRWKLAAQYIAAETEFWRCHRKAAGVMYFTALGYNRANGQTCDNWADLVNLTWEPEFLKQVSQSFAPVGLMIDLWADTLKSVRTVPVIAINDLGTEWKGDMRIRLYNGQEVVQEKTEPLVIPAYGQTGAGMTFGKELKDGKYTLEAALLNTSGGPVTSTRNVVVKH